MHTAGDPFEAGGVSPEKWLAKHINHKEAYALYNLPRQFCERYPDGLRRAQVLINVDSKAVVGSFNRGRAKNRDMHELLIDMFNLQISEVLSVSTYSLG